MDGQMNRDEYDKDERRPVSRRDFEDALRSVLLAPGPRCGARTGSRRRPSLGGLRGITESPTSPRGWRSAASRPPRLNSDAPSAPFGPNHAVVPCSFHRTRCWCTGSLPGLVHETASTESPALNCTPVGFAVDCACADIDPNEPNATIHSVVAVLKTGSRIDTSPPTPKAWVETTDAMPARQSSRRQRSRTPRGLNSPSPSSGWRRRATLGSRVEPCGRRVLPESSKAVPERERG